MFFDFGDDVADLARRDGIDDAVERAYTGWPDRLYIIDTDGRVRFKTGPGPFGFDTKALEDELAKIAPEKSPA